MKLPFDFPFESPPVKWDQEYVRELVTLMQRHLELVADAFNSLVRGWDDFTPVLTASTGTASITLNRTNRYTVIEKTLILTFYWELTLSATPAYLDLTLPGGYTTSHYTANTGLDNNGVTIMLQTIPGAILLRMFRDTAGTGTWPTGNHIIAGTATFPIQ